MNGFNTTSDMAAALRQMAECLEASPIDETPDVHISMSMLVIGGPDVALREAVDLLSWAVFGATGEHGNTGRDKTRYATPEETYVDGINGRFATFLSTPDPHKAAEVAS